MCRSGLKRDIFQWLVIKNLHYVCKFKINLIIRKIFWKLIFSTFFYWRILWVNINRLKWNGNTNDDWICCTVLCSGWSLWIFCRNINNFTWFSYLKNNLTYGIWCFTFMWMINFIGDKILFYRRRYWWSGFTKIYWWYCIVV